jgi:4-diphosphocytidyl-2C-methyl-D-erythritol kinase
LLVGWVSSGRARLLMEAMRATGQIEMRLTKHIPMGAGLGG